MSEFVHMPHLYAHRTDQFLHKFKTIDTRTFGVVIRPQRPAAVILTVSLKMRFYSYMRGVVATSVFNKYSSHVTLSIHKKNSFI